MLNTTSSNSYPDLKARDYTNAKIRRAFMKLPIEDQLVIESRHWDNAVIENTQGQTANLLVKKISQLDDVNYGAPPENSDIELNPETADSLRPQAWQNNNGDWFYNFPGAMQLAKELGRTLPNMETFLLHMQGNLDDFLQGAIGCREKNGEFIDYGVASSFWVSDILTTDDKEYNNIYAIYVFVRRDLSEPHAMHGSRKIGSPVRFLKEQK